MKAVPPRSRPLRSGTSFLPASSVILLSLFVKPHADAGRGKHQHRVERVHDLLESLHQSPPLSEFPLVRTPCRAELTGFFEPPPHCRIGRADRSRVSALAMPISKTQDLLPD